MSIGSGLAAAVNGFIDGRQVRHGWEDRKINQKRQTRLDELREAAEVRAEESHDLDMEAGGGGACRDGCRRGRRRLLVGRLAHRRTGTPQPHGDHAGEPRHGCGPGDLRPCHRGGRLQCQQRQQQAKLTDPGVGQEELGEGAPGPAAAGQHGIQPGMAGGQPRSFGLRQPIAAPHQAFEP